MKMKTELRIENWQEGNTWFSRAGIEPDIQLHTDYAVWVALGKPKNIRVTIEPVEE
jgi:hypothetical protein